jgi:hypothetical protein
LERDVEENLTDYGIAPTAAQLVNERPNLLVTWPPQPESFGNRGYTPVGLSYWTVLVVEVRNRRYEASAEAG